MNFIEQLLNDPQSAYMLTLSGRLLLNLFFSMIVIDKIYYRTYRQKENLFAFTITNILLFFVTSLIATVKIKTGVAFGMFAIFSILRFRTETMQVKEMNAQLGKACNI